MKTPRLLAIIFMILALTVAQAMPQSIIADTARATAVAAVEAKVPVQNHS